MNQRRYVSPNRNPVALERIVIEPEHDPVKFSGSQIENAESLIAQVSFCVDSSVGPSSTFVVRTQIDQPDKSLGELVDGSYQVLVSQCGLVRGL